MHDWKRGAVRFQSAIKIRSASGFVSLASSDNLQMNAAINIRDRQLSSVHAEAWIAVVPDAPEEGLCLTGCLRGPRSHYSSTVEVAYYLQPLPRPLPDAPGVTMRAIIPEPSLWEPETPFLYEGTLCLTRNDEHIGDYPVCHGFRSLEMCAQGLRLNRKPFTIRGVVRDVLDKAATDELRASGINTILCSTSEAMIAVCDLADRLGFLVLGKVTDKGIVPALAGKLSEHPSFAGWLASKTWAGGEATMILPGISFGPGADVEQLPANSRAKVLLNDCLEADRPPPAGTAGRIYLTG